MFRCNADGIKIKFRFNKLTSDNFLYDDWSVCSFSFVGDGWLNYSKDNRESFLVSEIILLEKELTGLINSSYKSPKHISLIEPDFSFVLHPSRSVKNNISGELVAIDYYAEWRVNFWNEGLTDNFLSVELNKKEIIKLRDYLRKVLNKK